MKPYVDVAIQLATLAVLWWAGRAAYMAAEAARDQAAASRAQTSIAELQLEQMRAQLQFDRQSHAPSVRPFLEISLVPETALPGVQYPTRTLRVKNIGKGTAVGGVTVTSRSLGKYAFDVLLVNHEESVEIDEPFVGIYYRSEIGEELAQYAFVRQSGELRDEFARPDVGPITPIEIQKKLDKAWLALGWDRHWVRSFDGGGDVP